MVDHNRRDAEDGLIMGFNDIPHSQKIMGMSFIQLSDVFHSCETGSTKFHVIEREMKKRLAQDQAKINRPNMLWAAGIGGIFALSGVVLGWYLNTPAPRQITPASAVQQAEKGDLGIKPSITKIPQPVTAPVTQSPPHPTDVSKDAQPSKVIP